MSRRPPSQRDPEFAPQRVDRALVQRVPGTGRMASAAPAGGGSGNGGRAEIRGAGSPSSPGVRFARDRYELTAAAPTLLLSFLPVPDSPHVYLNGIEQDEAVDYTLTERSLTVLAPMDAIAGDVIDVRYAYLSGLPGLPRAASDAPAVTEVVETPTADGEIGALTFLTDLIPPEGALLVAFLNVDTFAGSGATASAPDGDWTPHVNEAAATVSFTRMQILSKVAGAGETGSYSFPISLAGNHTGVLVVLERGAVQDVTVLTSSDLDSPTIDDPVGGGRVLAVFMADDDASAGATFSNGFELLAELNNNAHHNTVVGQRTAATAPGEAGITTTVTTDVDEDMSATVLIR